MPKPSPYVSLLQTPPVAMPLPNKGRAAGSGVAKVSDSTVTVPFVGVGLKEGSKL
jgi:hypothetical protein